MYFESHAHYDDERFDDDRDELLSSFPDEGIETVINSSSDIDSSKASIAYSKCEVTKMIFTFGRNGLIFSVSSMPVTPGISMSSRSRS